MSSQLHSPVLSGRSRKAIWSHCACLRGKAKQPLKSSSYSSRFAIQNRKILILGMPSFRFRHMLENFQSSGAHTNIGHPRMWQRSKRCRSARLPLSLKLANITLKSSKLRRVLFCQCADHHKTLQFLIASPTLHMMDMVDMTSSQLHQASSHLARSFRRALPSRRRRMPWLFQRCSR